MSEIKISQNSKNNKVYLIINDFESNVITKKVPIDINNTYLTLYEDCLDYKKLFAFFTKH